MPEPKAASTFEDALSALEARVRQLEAGEVSLDQALKLYEEGVALAEQCHVQLEAAEARVVQLTTGDKGIEEVPIPDVDG